MLRPAAYLGFLSASLLHASLAETDLGGGIVTSTDVQSFADLSQDVAEIQNLISTGQPEEGLGVYNRGQHSESSPGVTRSLKSLSDELVASDPKTPSYLFHLYGQSDRTLNLAFDQQKLGYVNSNIKEVFNSKPAVAVEAIWVINLWMYATHLLYTGIYDCKKRSMAENPSIFPIGMAGWDKFIALWIGSGQTPAQTNGDSLYKWAQELGDTMGTSDPEASVNTRIKLLFQEASTILNVEGACTMNNPETAGQLWQLVVQAVSEMSKPLFQGFVQAMTDKNADLVNVYAKALVPQLSKCRPSIYKRLHEALIINSYNANDDTTLQGILNDIPGATSCFGYSCSELGNTGLGVCANHNDETPSFAGYIPSTPVGAVGKADLDVYQIKILTELASNEFAEYLYLHGGNIAKFRQGNDPIEYVSLHDIGISSERSSAQPWFDTFVGYNGDKDYADKTIREALGGTSKWVAAQQISLITSTTAAYQIILMEAVTKLKIAVAECRDTDPELGPSFVLNPIDEAAALLIGSMEGSQLGGSQDLEDGQLIFAINNEHAFRFGTRNKYQYADSVSEIEDLLFAAKAQLAALDCEDLEKTTEAVLKYSMVGVVQACIYLASINENLNEFSTAGTLAEAEGLALSILPLIHANDTATADKLAFNFIREQGTTPVPSGKEMTGATFGKGFTYAMQLPCHNLGSILVVDPCDGPWGTATFGSGDASNSAATVPAASLPLVWTAAAATGTLLMMFLGF